MNAPAPGPAIFWVAWGSYVLLEAWVAFRDHRAGVRASTSDAGVLSITVTFVGAAVLAFVAAWKVDSLDLGGWAPLVVGVALIAAGIALRLWAILTLGQFFRRIVVIQKGHRVVTEGPYRYVRHPSYTGALLSMLGTGIALGNVLSIAICLIVPALGYIPRIPTEEAELERGLGEEYRRYEARTARLIPGVW
jgi:protein-S-isoprenylcysteine O-methyltransferase Ste14